MAGNAPGDLAHGLQDAEQAAIAVDASVEAHLGPREVALHMKTTRAEQVTLPAQRREHGVIERQRLLAVSTR